MPKVKISVCTLVLNEEKKLKECLDSVKDWTSEIVVGVDSSSNDKSEEIAKTFTNKVVLLDHRKNFHINKKKVIKEAKQDWILWLDGDEKVSQKLRQEIESKLVNSKVNGYWMPRKNIIFGRWIEHSGWYPDHQIRLFKKNKAEIPCKRIHEDIKVVGKTEELNGNLIHYNYESVSQFIDKLNHYTSLDAKYLNKELAREHLFKALIVRPMNEFVKRFMALEGYQDGFHGLVLSLLQAFYELVVVIKVWEIRKFEPQEMGEIEDIENTIAKAVKDWRWWRREVKIRSSKSIRKLKHRLLRKIGR